MNIFTKKKIDATHINIKLKPIFGIAPEKYIPVIYTILLIIILFSLIVLPGILKNGSLTKITSSPEAASVWIDGKRVGSTPVTTFVQKGNKKVTLIKENFETVTDEHIFKGRLFFSLFNKRNDELHFNINSKNGSKVLKTAYNELAEWSLTPSDEITERYRIPFFLSKAVTDYKYSEDFNKKEAKNFLNSSIKMVTNKYILSDYLRSYFILNSDNRMPSISTLKNSLNDLSKVNRKSKNLELLLYSNVLSGIDFNLERYQKLINNSKKIIDNSVTSYESSMDSKTIGNYTFNYIPKGEITPLETNFIHEIKENSFFLSDKMITREDFNKFISDSPYWSRDNIDELIKKSLVDENYLKFENEEKYVTNISYYAAREWISWANKNMKIPAGYKLALPTESQWLSATLYGATGKIEAWNWTSQGYYTFDHFLTDENGQFIDEYSFIEPRLVVGSNKYNTRSGNARGVQKANWCTPFLGFRPVLIKED